MCVCVCMSVLGRITTITANFKESSGVVPGQHVYTGELMLSHMHARPRTRPHAHVQTYLISSSGHTLTYKAPTAQSGLVLSVVPVSWGRHLIRVSAQLLASDWFQHHSPYSSTLSASCYFFHSSIPHTQQSRLINISRLQFVPEKFKPVH